MASRRSRRPPSLNLSLSSRETSPTNRTTPSPDPDTDDERMSNGYNNNRPLSVAYPSGPYCVKRPSLSEVLSNTAGAPFTLTAFMAFLSQNHCLETLEFTMDATRYRKYFNACVAGEDNKSPAAAEKGREYVRMLWRKILDAYIVPNGPREVNLPCTVRNHILNLPSCRTPPPPESLDSAVNIVYELMQESVLMPFISDCQQQAACAGHYPWGEAAQSDENLCMRGSLDERFLRRRNKRDSSPPPLLDFVSNSYSNGSTRQQRAASPFSASLGWHRNSAGMGPGSWGSGSGDSLMMMVEDSGTSSPGSFANPMTPPTTPPTCESMLSTSTTSSPKHKTTVDKAAKGWKNMTDLRNLGKQLGWSKKKGPQIWSDNGSF
ncbi:RGS domain-containing protein [Tuber brumale]|nr:RGS domain-containing protein [Tuber brumale]